MEGIRQYLLSLSAAALICAVVISFFDTKGSIGSLVKLIAGIFLVTVIIKPAVDLKLSDLSSFYTMIETDSREAVSAGEEMASEAMKQGIMERSAAYILEEAKNLDCELTVDVTLSEYVPSGVTLRGAVSPYAKTRLSQWIKENLGIPMEAQQWIG